MATGTEKRQRQKMIAFRVSDAEFDSVQHEADRAGVAVGTYARDLLIGSRAERRVRRPPATKAELAKILGQLGKIGSNVNQLARQANGGQLRILEPLILVELQEELEDIRAEIMRALGRTP
jgi:hypothetical protein